MTHSIDGKSLIYQIPISVWSNNDFFNNNTLQKEPEIQIDGYINVAFEIIGIKVFRPELNKDVIVP